MVSQKKYLVKGNKIYLWQKLCQQTIRLNKMKFQKSERNIYICQKQVTTWNSMAACPCLKITDHSCTSLQCICISSTFFFSTYSIYSMLLLHCFNDNLSFYINQSMTQIETLRFPCHIKKIQFVGYTSTNLWLNTQTFHQI